jgi:hypothetical protein
MTGMTLIKLFEPPLIHLDHLPIDSRINNQRESTNLIEVIVVIHQLSELHI